MKDSSKMRNADKKMIRDVRWGGWRNAHDSDFKMLFGMQPKNKWPAEGMPKREVQGFTMYVMSFEEARKKWPNKRRAHRCRAICPVCNKDLSAGRVHQHQH